MPAVRERRRLLASTRPGPPPEVSRPYRTGFCADGNPTDSHARCKAGITNRGTWLPCSCWCHWEPEPAANTEEPMTTTIPPGLHHDLSNEAYHADQDYLSSTVLKHQLPERFKDSMSQDALDFGSLFHAVVLEPDKVTDLPAELGIAVLDPVEIGVKKDGSKADSPTQTTAWREAVQASEAAGRRVMQPHQWQAWIDRAEAMRDAVVEHDEAARLLFDEPGESEVSAFWQPPDGIGHKARFDRLLNGRAVDLKSTSARPGEDSLSRTVIDYGYDLSAAHYLAVAEGLALGVTEFWFVFVGKEPPHYVTVCNLSPDFLTRGRVLRALAIERLTDDTAPAYQGAHGHLTLTPPPYARLAPTVSGIPADFTWSLDDYA